MIDIKKFTRHTTTQKIAYFTLPTYLAGALSLITFPVIAAQLGVREFGQLDLFLLLGTVLNYGLQFGWASAHNRYYLENDIRQSDLVKTLFWVRLGIYILALALTLLTQHQVLDWLGADSKHRFALWLVLGIFISADLSQFYSQRYRMLNKAGHYALFSGTKAILYPLFILPALFIFEPSPITILFATFLSGILPLMAALLLDNAWLLSGHFNKRILKRVLVFGVPLVPAALAVMAIQVLDRAMLRSLIPEVETSLLILGYYAFALRLVALTNLATSGFSILWGPYVYRTYEHPDAPKIYRMFFSSYLFILFSLVFFIIVVSHWLVPIFMPDFSAALDVLIVLLASALLYSLGDYFCIGIGIAKKTWIRAMSGGVSVFVNLSLNFMLIPVYGGLGAALATFIATATYVILLMAASHKLYTVHYPFSRLLGGAALILLSILVKPVGTSYLAAMALFCTITLLAVSFREFKGLYAHFYG